MKGQPQLPGVPKHQTSREIRDLVKQRVHSNWELRQGDRERRRAEASKQARRARRAAGFQNSAQRKGEPQGGADHNN